MRSKPDPVDQPQRTAHYDCAMCIAKMLHNTIVNIPLPPVAEEVVIEITIILEMATTTNVNVTAIIVVSQQRCN